MFYVSIDRPTRPTIRDVVNALKPLTDIPRPGTDNDNTRG